MKIFAGNQRMGIAAILMAASAFLSRLMGLIRDKLISWQFGASSEADLYFAAFVTPDIINYLLAGGFMSITIIPILGNLFQKDESSAWAFFSCILFWMTLAALILTLIGEICAQPIACVTAPGFTAFQLERLAFFTRIILPGQIFFLAGAPFTALLFLRRQFTAPAFSPIIYNGCIILLGVSLPLLISSDENFGMTGYCLGVTIGALLGAFMLPLWVALKDKVHFRFTLCHPELKQFLWIALPLMLGQTVVMLDEQFLRIFGSMLEEGSVSILNYARRIAQVPVSLVGQAAAVASYPFLVKLLAEKQQEQFYSTLNIALKTSISFIIPCSMGLIAAAGPILGAIFEGGQFGPEETASCLMPTQLMLCASPLWVLYMIVARGYYAHADTLTPAVTGTVITLGCIPLYYLIAVPLGINAIACVSSFALAAYLAWLMLIWKKRHGSHAFAGLAGHTIRALLCALLPTFAAWLAIHFITPALAGLRPFFSYALACITGGAIFILVFIPFAIRLQPELLARFKKISNP